MAGNDWVNSYLEAILDVGGQGIESSKDKKTNKNPSGAASLLLRERGHFSPSRYFVEEVITGFDETDLHRSWLRAASTRSPQERNTRLENLCWRIWNLARKKKQIESEEVQRLAKRRMEREKGRREATADMSEDLSEGEKGDTVGDMSFQKDSNKGKMRRISSVDMMENWANNFKEKKLYIVLIRQGVRNSFVMLIDPPNFQLDLFQQVFYLTEVKYVVELARALGSMPGVYRVDLLTRQVSGPGVDWSYAQPCEMLTSVEESPEELGESSGAYIIRIPFGPKDKYVAKELLWPYIPEFVDGALGHIRQMSKVLGDLIGAGRPLWPTSIHGHYADAGDSAALLSGALNVPMVFTGHSLGRDKLEQLLKQGRLSRDEINTTYKIMRRIEAEELCLDASEIVITSTRQEIEEQWQLYDGFDLILERKLRARMRRGVNCHGRFMPRMARIPPGMEFHHIAPHDADMDADLDGHKDDKANPDPFIWSEIMRFFSNRRKPMILALARPDPKKNLTTLVKAFGECRPLRELANLTLIMGNRDDIDEMSGTNASVLISILKLIDKYDLYGQVAYPKHHKQSEVPEIYRLAAKTKGVFINPAFIEPFGLTLIEAAAYGLPIVATKNGGPVDIIGVLDNGLLIDPHDQQSIADALLKLVADKQLWAKCRQNGLKNIHLFSWPEHCKAYLSRIASCKPRQPNWQRVDEGSENSDTDSPGDSLRDIQDISLNLKFSVDTEKPEGGNTFDDALESEEASANTRRKIIENAVSKMSKPMDKGNFDAGNHKFPAIRRRKYIFVIALDVDETTDLLQIVKAIFSSVGEQKTTGSIGFVLSTAMTLSEVNTLLSSGGMKPGDFDAFICNSGSELYYSSIGSEESDSPFVLDQDYHSHINYRWGGDGLRKTLLRWAASVNEKKGGTAGQIVSVDEAGSTAHCFSFKVNDFASAPPAKELRKLMRIQALRCHAIHCVNGSRLNVIPVLASRSQALRYLYIRWGTELSNFVVFVGESGDTDYEGLLGGVHKTVVLKDVCTDSRKLHVTRNYPLEHVVPVDTPNVFQTQGHNLDDMKEALSKLGISK
ncbi:hypothetical protein KSS87_004144 [Heliosperma pusillum]|nr:hypothetical protein KSS87_004144 [Heliosperma pusillum]